MLDIFSLGATVEAGLAPVAHFVVGAPREGNRGGLGQLLAMLESLMPFVTRAELESFAPDWWLPGIGAATPGTKAQPRRGCPRSWSCAPSSSVDDPSRRELLHHLAPDAQSLDDGFERICHDALDHEFEMSRTNANWEAETRPILEAFWHCKYFLGQLNRYVREIDEPVNMLPEGWAAVLELYGLR